MTLVDIRYVIGGFNICHGNEYESNIIVSKATGYFTHQQTLLFFDVPNMNTYWLLDYFCYTRLFVISLFPPLLLQPYFGDANLMHPVGHSHRPTVEYATCVTPFMPWSMGNSHCFVSSRLMWINIVFASAMCQRWSRSRSRLRPEFAF